MEITFATKKIKDIFTNAVKLKKSVGAEMCKKIIKRMLELEQFDNIGELMQRGLDNPHVLVGDLANHIAWEVSRNYRLILKFEKASNEEFNTDVQRKETICIEGVLDYHGSKDRWIIN